MSTQKQAKFSHKLAVACVGYNYTGMGNQLQFGSAMLTRSLVSKTYKRLFNGTRIHGRADLFIHIIHYPFPETSPLYLYRNLNESRIKNVIN